MSLLDCYKVFLRAGYCHNDIKSDNIGVDSDDKCQLYDFDISNRTGEDLRE